ncbi:MAG: methionyl-tRNA formyltransferase [Chloroflexi bacterium]|nr:methionyl-tRNA formyltransferase [Chloroflexota bacterium]
MPEQQVMKAVLLSSTTFGRRCLEEGILNASNVRVTGILTTPREIEISYSDKPVEINTHAKFDDLADRIGCDVVSMTGKMDSQNYLQYLHQWAPDLLLVLGWYYMIPRKVRESAQAGCVGIHASLLPKYRGGAPIPWAIINGETETGVTFFHFGDGVDDGDIIAQKRFPITSQDTVATIYEKATSSSIVILREYLPKLATRTAPRIQQDHNQATYFPQRSPEDGLIDWSWDAKRIRDFIRAQTRPYSGAFTYLEGKRITIWDADAVEIEIVQ